VLEFRPQRQHGRRTGLDRDLRAYDRREHGRGRGRSGEFAEGHDALRAFEFEPRKRSVPLEAGGDPVAAVRQRHPQLQALDERGLAQRELGVRDAGAAGHEVQLAGAQQHVRAEAVAVPDLARYGPGHGLEPGVRVGEHRHVRALGPELVEEAPSSHGGHLPLRQGAADVHGADAAERHVPGLQQDRLGPGVAGGPAGLFHGANLEIAHAVTLARERRVGSALHHREC
jgi:hypothetical protein